MAASQPAASQPAASDSPESGHRPAERPLRLWRQVSLRRQIAYGFAIPVLIVILASLYVAKALDSMRAAAQASLASSQEIGLRDALLYRVVDAETGLRGYLLTSDPEFLAPYQAAPVELERIGRQLDTSEADEQETLRKLREVQVLFKRWRDEFAEPLIRLRRDAPVGIGESLEHLAELAVAARTPEQQRALSVAGAQLQRKLAHGGDGSRSGELRLLLKRMEDDAIRDPATLTRLRGLATAYRDDDEQITAITQSKRGKRLIDQIRAVLKVSLEDEQQQQRQRVDAATASTERARWIARLAPVTALVIGLWLVLLLLLDAIRAISTLTRAAQAVAGGALDKRVPVMRRDELGQLGQAFNRMAAELEDDHRRNAALDRFQTLLVTSNTLDELYQVVGKMCTEMFPHTGGAIYRIAASRNMAEMVLNWQWPQDANGRVLEPAECRALRTGQPYLTTADSLEVPCRHTERLGIRVANSLCLPLSAQGETHGILHLCRFSEAGPQVSVRAVATATLIGEQFAMALANLQLREQLRSQAIRDPLTGLFNRRYLEETMERELARSVRNGLPLAVAAIDVDHFKRFNDTHGHEAGDRVLMELAAMMRAAIRTTDIACRYGGEEFVLLMPDSPLAVATQRAEELCARARALRLRFGSGAMEPITISIGLAAAPTDGDRADVLLRNADSALYAAKASGRDRVMAYRAP